MTNKLSPCSHCRSPHPSVKKQSGRVGVTKTSYYREIIRCKSCKVEDCGGLNGPSPDHPSHERHPGRGFSSQLQNR